jgi:hypothetical protein
MTSRFNFFILVFLSALSILSCQETPKSEAKETPPPDFKSFLEKLEKDNLSQEFQGVQTEAGKQTNLFSIKATGVSTESIVLTAEDFLFLLTPEQKTRTSFSIDDSEWRRWSNVDNGIYKRQGVSIKELSAEQREKAFALMQASLSVKGLALSKDIMKTDQTLREYNNDDPAFDEELYFFTIMGEPSATEPWGWQIDGHHLVINYFVLGDQVVMSPVFMGGEPIITTTGRYKGNTLFQDEQNKGLAFMQTLNAAQQQIATLDPIKTNNDNKAAASRDNVIINYEGIQVKELSQEQKESLSLLVEQYITNMREGHSKVRMEEIKAHWNDTWFAWVGDTTDDAVFYYRIHSPVVLIEFDHQGIIGMPRNGHKGPSRNHIHTVVRTPNGNDYGKDLLQQHIDAHHH